LSIFTVFLQFLSLLFYYSYIIFSFN